MKQLKKKGQKGKPNGFARHSTEDPIWEFNPDVLSGHEWRQQGPYLICKSCELTHALYIGMNKILVGFREDGKPILEKR